MLAFILLDNGNFYGMTGGKWLEKDCRRLWKDCRNCVRVSVKGMLCVISDKWWSIIEILYNLFVIYSVWKAVTLYYGNKGKPIYGADIYHSLLVFRRLYENASWIREVNRLRVIIEWSFLFSFLSFHGLWVNYVIWESSFTDSNKKPISE